MNGDSANGNDPSGLFTENTRWQNNDQDFEGGGGGGGGGDGGAGGGGGGGGTPAAKAWNNLSPTCQKALQTAIPNSTTAQMVAALNRANAAMSTLQAATSGTSISWTMLAAIGIRESGFQNITESDGVGLGVGVFQISVPGSGLTAAQAGNLTTAANYSAQLLNSNMAYLASTFGYTGTALLQATAASFNMNPYKPGNFTGNPSTIDVGTTGGNYGTNVLQLMSCFK